MKGGVDRNFFDQSLVKLECPITASDAFSSKKKDKSGIKANFGYSFALEAESSNTQYCNIQNKLYILVSAGLRLKG